MQENYSLLNWLSLALFVICNFVAFFMMIIDKRMAREGGKTRISEGDLFFFSICFGALGILLGMKLARHKTQKWKFIIGVPLALIQNIALFWVVFEFVK